MLESSLQPDAAAERPPLRIAVVDDHSIIRAVFKYLAEDVNDLHLVWSAPDLKEARRLFATEQPDFLIVDVSLPDGEGYDFVAEVLRTNSDLPVMMISMNEERVFAERAFHTGAKGYVVKNSSPAELLSAIHIIRDGGMCFKPEIEALSRPA